MKIRSVLHIAMSLALGSTLLPIAPTALAAEGVESGSGSQEVKDSQVDDGAGVQDEPQLTAGAAVAGVDVPPSESALQAAEAAGSRDEEESNSQTDSQTDSQTEPSPTPEPTLQATPLKTPVISSVTQISGGLQVAWSKVSKASTYVITRTDLSTSKTASSEVASSAGCFYEDLKVTAGHTYSYSIVARPAADAAVYCDSDASEAVTRLYVGTPFISSAKRSGSIYKVIWAAVDGIDGYQIQYSTSPLLLRCKTAEVNAIALSYEVAGVSSSKTYYARVRAYQLLDDGSRLFGPWSYSKDATSTNTTKTKLLKAGNTTFELRTAAGQSMYGYDTLQGSCTDGTFGYYALHNKSNNKGKIVKVDMTNMRILKISKALSICHANDLCYDPVDQRILVVNGEGNWLNLASIDAGSLKVRSEHALSSSVKNIPGAARAGVKKISGVSGIAYNSQRGLFVVSLSGSHDFLILDRSFKALQYIRPKVKSSGLFQGLECTNDLLLVCTSPNSAQGTNSLFVYNWDGSYVSRLNISSSYELESVFHKGGRLYASFYSSWFERITSKSALKSTKRKSSSKGKLTVKWTKRSSAKKYKVYYRVTGKKTWKSKVVSGSKRSVTLKKLKKKRRYEVKVKAIGKWSEFRRSGYTYKLASV